MLPKAPFNEALGILQSPPRTQKISCVKRQFWVSAHGWKRHCTFGNDSVVAI